MNECGSEVRFDFKCRWMMDGEGEFNTIEYHDGEIEILVMKLILNEDIDWIVELWDNGEVNGGYWLNVMMECGL